MQMLWVFYLGFAKKQKAVLDYLLLAGGGEPEIIW